MEEAEQTTVKGQYATALSDLRVIWQEVLGMDEVVPQDNFIRLGGDSLSALIVSAKARELGYDMPRTAALTTTTLHDLAEMVVGSRS